MQDASIFDLTTYVLMLDMWLGTAFPTLLWVAPRPHTLCMKFFFQPYFVRGAIQGLHYSFHLVPAHLQPVLETA